MYANVRFDDARLCLLVLIGARADGKKELIAVEDGYRESEQLRSSFLSFVVKSPVTLWAKSHNTELLCFRL